MLGTLGVGADQRLTFSSSGPECQMAPYSLNSALLLTRANRAGNRMPFGDLAEASSPLHTEPPGSFDALIG